MGLVLLLLLVVTLIPGAAIVAGGLHLSRRPAPMGSLGVALVVLGALWAGLGILAVVAVVQGMG